MAGALFLLAICHPPLTFAQDRDGASPSHDSEAVAKELNNPVSSMVSVPLQFNWDQGVGVNDDLRTTINFQPVIPVELTDDVNLITRFILPYINQPVLVPGGATASGTSDILLSLFLSPAKAGKMIWAVGPVFSLPTTTDPMLGSGKWSAGPTGLVLEQSGPWTVGVLVNHLWSFADTGDIERTEVNQTFIQPFLAHTSKSALTFNINSEATANWKARNGEEWTIPINFALTRVIKLGPFPFSVGGGVGYYVETPEGGPEWKLRLIATLILPGGK
jgi:hypothetical protein